MSGFDPLRTLGKIMAPIDGGHLSAAGDWRYLEATNTIA